MKSPRAADDYQISLKTESTCETKLTLQEVEYDSKDNVLPNNEIEIKADICGESCNQDSKCVLGEEIVIESAECTVGSDTEKSLILSEDLDDDDMEVKVFVCQQCYFVTLDNNELINHMLTHGDPSEVAEADEQNELCKSKNNNELLESELDVVISIKAPNCENIPNAAKKIAGQTGHPVEKLLPFQGSVSNRISFESEHGNDHDSEKKLVFYKCEKCYYTSDDKSKLKLHSRTHSKQRPFKTKIIDLECQQTPEKIQKMYPDHSKIDNKNKKDPVPLTESYEDDVSVKMEEEKYLIDDHQIFIKTEKQADANSFLSESDTKDENNSHTSFEYEHVGAHDLEIKKLSSKIKKCDKCNYTTIEKCRLDRHQLTHSSDVNTFKCNRCSFRAKTKIALECHQIVREFQCDECPYHAKSELSLEYHKYNHRFPRAFKCNKCTYQTTTKACLFRHQSLHFESGEQQNDNDITDASNKHVPKSVASIPMETLKKMFPRLKCDKCDYSTIYRATLKQHQLKHTEVRPYKCDKCPYRAKTTFALRIHQKVRKFGCDECPFDARSRQALKFHKYCHRFEGPLKCNICTYQARNKSSLKLHQLLHDDKIEKAPCGNYIYWAMHWKKSQSMHPDDDHDDSRDGDPNPAVDESYDDGELLGVSSVVKEENWKMLDDGYEEEWHNVSAKEEEEDIIDEEHHTFIKTENEAVVNDSLKHESDTQQIKSQGGSSISSVTNDEKKSYTRVVRTYKEKKSL